MKSRILQIFMVSIAFLYLTRCATDPGTGTPVSGSAICTYDNCDFDVIVKTSSRSGEITAALLPFTSVNGARKQALSVSSDVLVSWPPTVSVTGCSSSALTSATLYPNPPSKIYIFDATQCSNVQVSVTLTITNTTTGASRTIGASGSSSQPGVTQTYSIFVTSTTSNGNLGGLSGGDAFCQTRGNAGTLTGPLGKTWKMVASDATTSAASRLEINGKVYDIQGNLIANNSDDLWDGTISNPVKYDEDGNDIVAGTRYWTGSDSSGNPASTCGSWTNGVAGNGTVGDASATDSGWITTGVVGACFTQKNLICISQ